ncbi:MAG: 4Fe-4S binding protein [Gemmatimonadaceae bacterium]|nr:4Fe-4S binding protein [Gemmatimonadaceae bacterium]
MRPTRGRGRALPQRPAAAAGYGGDLLRSRLLRTLLRSRWPQFLIRGAALAGLGLAVLAGFIGTPVGSLNLGIVLVWIAWWSLLILLALPLLGRGWCSICPIPMPGEWLQQGALVTPRPTGVGLKRPWPARFRNIWLQNAAFSLIAVCSAIVLTQPRVTAIVLIAFLGVATGVSLVFERRSFCRYLCPVGGFIGLYAQLAPIAVRVKDTATCAGHREKSCYRGSPDGAGCPWMLFPGTLAKNTYCGMCMECVRTCPHDNIAVTLRPFGADLWSPSGRRLDEAFKGFIMLGAAMVYSAVMLGPWGSLKLAAYDVGSLRWVMYALTVLAFLYLALPGLFLAAVGLGRALAGATQPIGRAFVAFSYALVPLGLLAWIAFSLSFVSASISYLWPTLSDPFGRGWDLFGTAEAAWQPYLSGALPWLQAAVLLIGLFWSSRMARRIAAEDDAGRASTLQAAPIIVFCALVTVAFLGLLIA